jgi:hypothetical protein
MRLLALLLAAVATPALAQTIDHSAHGDHAGHMAPAEQGAMAGQTGERWSSGPEDAMAHRREEAATDRNRDASGTSWQPAASPMMQGHAMNGEWMVMRHATLDLVHSSQGGPRGDDKTFVAGMAMASAERDLGAGAIRFRAMLSPEPLMGKAGYPLLLAVGETADGTSHLVDRQHPHDLFMELSATYTRHLGERRSAYVYAGLPGEPAFGPPAFMHRTAAASPEAPISHHWLDSTHITFGVITAGYVSGDWKVETSAFRGREPDQNRYDIESPKLDSGSVRVSWNPTAHWALQASYADIASPEQLAPTRDETRWSVSALYARPLGQDRLVAATFAYGSKTPDGDDARDAALIEVSYTTGPWTAFTRAEWTEQDELAAGHVLYDVGKVSVGALYEIPVNAHVGVGLGGLVSAYAIPDALDAGYDSPTSGMAFLRLTLH